MHTKLIYLILLTVFFSTVTFADIFTFRHYSIENGLSNNTVSNIIQDSKGFMWFGSSDGLNRFDGNNFRIYRHIEGDTTSIGNNTIKALKEISNNEIWVGTSSGIYIYSPVNDIFRYPEKVIDGDITHIDEDSKGNIWVTTYGNGVYLYTNDGKMYNYMQSEETGLNSDAIVSLWIDSGDRVWISTAAFSKQLYYYDPVDNNFIYFNPIESPLLDRIRICNILEDTQGQFWITTWNDGLFLLDRRTGNFQRFFDEDSDYHLTHVHAISQHTSENLLIGSDDGLLSFNTYNKSYSIAKRKENDPRSLSDNAIYAIYCDREDGVWIGTYYGGVNYISRNHSIFERYAPSTQANSVRGHIISSFAEGPQGTIWIGSDDDGISSFNYHTKEFSESPTGLSYHNVHSLLVRDEELWIGTYTGGLNVMNIESGKFRYYTNNRYQMYGMSSIYSIYQDRMGTIWVGTMSGINTYDPDNNNFPRAQSAAGTIYDIIQDNSGTLWFASEGAGLFSYNLQTNTWNNYRFEEGNINSLSSNAIYSLNIDNYQRLWIGTYNGLCLWQPESQSFRRVELNLPSNTIYGIMPDRNTLWITTGKGLVNYNPENNNYRIFTKADGLQDDQFNPSAIFKSSNGSIYVGTINGFNVFSPDHITQNNYIPPVAITCFQIFNKESKVKSGEGEISVTYADEITLSHSQNVFSLDFASLSFSNPNNNRYAYKLEGFDKDWIMPESQFRATYTNLPAGKYVFHVKASNNDGLWNEDGARLIINIKPHILLSNFFIALYFLLLLVAVYFMVSYFTKRAKDKHDNEILALNREKETEVYNAKINFFTLVAHEIRTPVTLIIGPLENMLKKLKGKPQKEIKDLEVAYNNSQRLLTLVNQLLDFRKVEQGVFTIHLSELNVTPVINSVIDRFIPRIEQRSLILSQNIEESLLAVTDAEAITKIVSNLLTNAIKFAEKNINISCFKSEDDDKFMIVVKNDGEIISEREISNIFKPFYQIAEHGDNTGTGIGLSLVKLLTDAMNGKIEVESNESCGTTFSVTLPVKQASVEMSNSDIQSKSEVKQEIAINYDLNSLKKSEKNRLLIVEDNEDMREFVSDNLKDEFKVMTAIDGIEAIEIINENEFDLIVSDIMMPRMDGITLCERLKENVLTSHIPIILLTAKTDLASKIEGMKIGADAYIEKPFSIEFLKAQIYNLLESRRLLLKKFFDMPLLSLTTMAGNNTDRGFLNVLNEVLEANIANSDFSVEDLAQELNISRSGLFAKLKTLTGSTPNELMQIVRLKKAAELLSSTDHRVSEIAYMVGFKTPSYFTKCFAKQFKITPTEFIAYKNNIP